MSYINEYWVVTDVKTGKTLCHCAEISDAMLMVSFDPANRSYRRHRFLMDQVIDVTSTVDKQLPGQQGLPAATVGQLTPHYEKLPEGQQKPVVI